LPQVGPSRSKPWRRCEPLILLPAVLPSRPLAALGKAGSDFGRRFRPSPRWNQRRGPVYSPRELRGIPMRIAPLLEALSMLKNLTLVWDYWPACPLALLHRDILDTAILLGMDTLHPRPTFTATLPRRSITGRTTPTSASMGQCSLEGRASRALEARRGNSSLRCQPPGLSFVLHRTRA
jgi:hypothetical protein